MPESPNPEQPLDNQQSSSTGAVPSQTNSDHSQMYTDNPAQVMDVKRKIFLLLAIVFGAFAGIVTGLIILNPGTPAAETPVTTVPTVTLAPTAIKKTPTKKPSPTSQADSKNFYSEPFNIRFQYPQDTKIVTSKTAIDIVDSKTNETMVFSQNIKTRIIISTTSAVFRDLSQAERGNSIADPNSDLVYMKVADRTIDDNQAVDYSSSSGEGAKKRYLIGTILYHKPSNNYYEISASRDTEKELKAYKDTFDLIVSSIKIGK